MRTKILVSDTFVKIEHSGQDYVELSRTSSKCRREEDKDEMLGVPLGM